MNRRFVFGLVALVIMMAVGLTAYFLTGTPAPENESIAPPPAPPEGAPGDGLDAAAAAAASAPTAGPPVPASPEFLALQDEVLRSIPSRNDLRELGEEEVHYTPDVLVRAGQQLGRLAQAIVDDPKLIPHGIKFYETCALKAEYPAPVRALCYSDLKTLLLKQGVDRLPSEDDIPDEVKDLSEQL